MLPANRLELWFLIESERFKYPAFREFYSERDVVTEERRMYADNNPRGYLWEEFLKVAISRHPYRNPVVGFTEDLNMITRPVAMKFFDTFYIPNNMEAAIVGDVKLDEVKKLAEKYFGDFPSRPTPPRTLLQEPEQRGERRVNVTYGAQPQLLIGYQTAQTSKKEELALKMIASILSSGKSSRFTRDIINEKKMAVRMYAENNAIGGRYPSMFLIGGTTCHPNTPVELEKAVYDHLEQIKNKPVDQQEIDKVITKAEATLFNGMNSNMYIGLRILFGSLIEGTIDAEFEELARLKQVTAEDLMNVAQKYFTAEKRTVGILLNDQGGVS
jgi:predicted Zn-dependent peptidase